MPIRIPDSLPAQQGLRTAGGQRTADSGSRPSGGVSGFGPVQQDFQEV